MRLALILSIGKITNNFRIISSIGDDLYEPIFDPGQRRKSNLDNALALLKQFSRVNIQEQNALNMEKVYAKGKIYTSPVKQLARNSVFSVLSSQSENRRSSATSFTDYSDLDSELCEDLRVQIDNIWGFDFNIFKVNNLVGKRTLPAIAVEVFEQRDLIGDIFCEQHLQAFLNILTEGYSENKVAYHNYIHAADVLQTTNRLMGKGEFIEVNLKD